MRRNRHTVIELIDDPDLFSKESDSGEKRLIRAILERAIMDAIKPEAIPQKQRSRVYYPALEYLYIDPRDSEEEFSFDWILQHLFDDPEGAKANILRQVEAVIGSSRIAEVLATKINLH